MEIAVIPLLVVVVASIFQGSFGLGMKFMAPLKWESWWLVHSVVAMLLFPMVWAFCVVPDLLGIIAQASFATIGMAMFFGFLWGIGGILFGKCVPYIGMSLTYGIVMGVCSAVGCLIPFFQLDDAMSLPSFPYVIGGVMVMLIGVAFTAYAGILRDKHKAASETKIQLKAGLTIALVSGVLSALLNVGFSNAQPISQLAIAHGVAVRQASFAAWVVVLWGAFLMNGGYAIYLLTKNKTWGSFQTPQAQSAYKWSIIAGLCWFGALGIYGQGAALMGDMGPVIGWPILLGLSLIVSNVWAYLNHEWKAAAKPFAWLLVGLAILLVATVILGYANGVH